MFKLFLFLFSLLLSGCVGLTIQTIHTQKYALSEFSRSDLDLYEEYDGSVSSYTKEEIIQLIGEPDEMGVYKNCDVYTYRNGFSWSGVGAYIVVIPVPILFPTGIDEDVLYFREDKTVGIVKEMAQEQSSYGYMCGELRCTFLYGRVNMNGSPLPPQKLPEVEWCD